MFLEEDRAEWKKYSCKKWFNFRVVGDYFNSFLRYSVFEGNMLLASTKHPLVFQQGGFFGFASGLH